MTTRMKVLVGVSTLALWSGLTPAIPAVLAPAAGELGASGLAALLMPDAQAQEEGEGEEGTTECTPPEGESGEGEEGGTTECPPPDGESGEGEG